MVLLLELQPPTMNDVILSMCNRTQQQRPHRSLVCWSSMQDMYVVFWFNVSTSQIMGVSVGCGGKSEVGAAAVTGLKKMKSLGGLEGRKETPSSEG